jgi:hypothetical protein
LAIALVQGLLSGTIKTASTTLTISGSKTVTTGNTIYVAFFGSGANTGTVSASDNLGNTYSTIASGVNTSLSVTTVLLGGTVVTGGTLTSITTSGPSYNAAAALSAEFSGTGATNGTGNFTGSSATNLNAYPGGTTTTTATQIAGNLWIGAFGWRNAAGTFTSPVPSTSGVAASQPLSAVGTSGGSSSGNASVALAYFICNAATSNMLNGQPSTSQSGAAAGADINPAATVTSLLWKPRLGPNYRR